MTTPDDEAAAYHLEEAHIGWTYCPCWNEAVNYMKQENALLKAAARPYVNERCNALTAKLTEAEALIERLVKFVADAANTVPEPDTEHWTLQAQASDIIKSKAVAEWRKGKG